MLYESDGGISYGAATSVCATLNDRITAAATEKAQWVAKFEAKRAAKENARELAEFMWQERKLKRMMRRILKITDENFGTVKRVNERAIITYCNFNFWIAYPHNWNNRHLRADKNLPNGKTTYPIQVCELADLDKLRDATEPDWSQR